ncbi:hypothetical protein [Glutamicibacter sp.]|uniref:hypothetical protein n=1 Tax=Glutamicibacter sp. TaxID=1931995 RepID=UPI0028BD95F6|nr:hypothetical protein [Glutamicibacter sp.]
MSDNSQPVSSRRALREKRRAEMEALLANSQAEQAAKEQASAQEKPAADKKPAPSQQAKPAPEKPAASSAPAKPAAKQQPAPVPPKAKEPAAAKKPESKAPAKPAPATAKKPAPAKPEAAKPTQVKPTPAKPADQKSEAPAAEKPAAADASGERASLRRARDREALRERRRLEEEVGALTSHIPTVEPADDPKPLTRRQLRLQALADQGKGEAPAKSAQSTKPSAKTEKPVDSEQNPETTVMSVEDALAARRAHTPPAPVDPNLIGEDDSEIDLEVLAHQREMAARAAIISRRAAERERLRVENAKQGKDDAAPDPFTGALGNIRDVEDRIAKTGVSGPKTESVALSFKTPENKAAKPSPKPASAKPAAKPVPKATEKPAPKPAVQPAAVKSPSKPAPKPAVVPVQTASEAKDVDPIDMPRIEAVNAQGLQPLDVQTHGVRRANNMLIAMIVALGIGGAALIAGLIMLFSN